MQWDELPELKNLRVGDRVIVVPDPSDQIPVDQHPDARSNQVIPVRVMEVDQVWIEVEALKGERLPEGLRKFRRDTQSTSDRPGPSDPVFCSMGQWMCLLRNAKARAYLNEIGITLDAGSPFASDPMDLAAAIRRGLGEPELL